MKQTWLAALLVTFLTQGPEAQAQVVPTPTTTCYSWSLPDEPAAQDTASAWIILQDTVTLADWKRAYLHGPRLARRGWQPATWREHTADSIRVVMNGKFVKIVFTLHRAPDALTGYLDYTSDVVVRDSTGAFRPWRRVFRASAVPRPCPAG